MKIKKIIRDNIPEMVAKEQGISFPVVYVSNKESIGLLIAKLDEEVAEFKEAFDANVVLEGNNSSGMTNITPVVLEAADIVEVLESIISKVKEQRHFKTNDGVDTIAQARVVKNKCGKFERNICMLKD